MEYKPLVALICGSSDILCYKCNKHDAEVRLTNSQGKTTDYCKECLCEIVDCFEIMVGRSLQPQMQQTVNSDPEVDVGIEFPIDDEDLLELSFLAKGHIQQTIHITNKK